jgi:RNA polymerase sigma factor (sigma-70 family)
MSQREQGQTNGGCRKIHVPASPLLLTGTDYQGSTPSGSLDRDALFEEFQPLIRRLVRQYGDCAENRQDLTGEIYYKFSALVDAYDPARGIPFRPYMVRQLSAAIYTYARQGWRRQKREISLDVNAGLCDSAYLHDPSGEWNDKLANEQVLQTLPESICKLPKRQRQVVIWRYYDQRSFEDIAIMLDVQPATARSLLRHGLNNLRLMVRPAYADY